MSPFVKISGPLASDPWQTDIVLSFLSWPCVTSCLIVDHLPNDIQSF